VHLPDALLAFQRDTGSAVLALEVDEGTEHAPVIRDKLEHYALALADRDEWYLLFVVGEPERARWIVGIARRNGSLARRAERGWVTTVEELRVRGLDARVASLGDAPPRHVTDLCVAIRRRQTPHPIGADAWLRLMGSGAGEDLGAAFAIGP
jgi:hypothetical protein